MKRLHILRDADKWKIVQQSGKDWKDDKELGKDFKTRDAAIAKAQKLSDDPVTYDTEPEEYEALGLGEPKKVEIE